MIRIFLASSGSGDQIDSIRLTADRQGGESQSMTAVTGKIRVTVCIYKGRKRKRERDE